MTIKYALNFSSVTNNHEKSRFSQFKHYCNLHFFNNNGKKTENMSLQTVYLTVTICSQSNNMNGK